MSRRYLMAGFLALFVTGAAQAQGVGALVGTWQRFSIVDSTGAQMNLPPAILIMGADGYYAQVAVPPGRAKVNKPAGELSLEELRARFGRVEARVGKYSVNGDRLTRTYLTSSDPNQEGGSPQVQQFRIEGDVLLLGQNIRFRRLK